MSARMNLFLFLWCTLLALVWSGSEAARLPFLLREGEEEWDAAVWGQQLRAGRLRLDNGLARTPPMGWNSWNHFGCKIDEAMVEETADALVASGLAELGYVYLNVDDCWAAWERGSHGELVARPDTFPSGMKALADYAHGLGLKLGIYSDAGFYTCQRQPGSLGFEEQDAALFASWEIDYLKYDNCYTDGSKPEVRYPVMRDALNNTGRPILFSMCEWGVDDPAEWAGGVGNTWRTTGDIADRWDSMVDIAHQNDRWAAFAGPGGWNDPDMLEVGNGGMSLEEYRGHFSLWALMKAPLLIGGDLRNMSGEYLAILSNREVIAVNQDSLGVQGRRVSLQDETGLEVWAGPLSQGRVAVLLWNRSLLPAAMSVSWEDLGIEHCQSAVVRDLWEHRDMVSDDVPLIEVHVVSHGVKMYTVSPIWHKAPSF